jgi:hypothetical protein
MTPLCAGSDTAQVVAAEAYLPRNAAFFLLASITVSFVSSSTALTPLYALYQGRWGSLAVASPITSDGAQC